MRKFLILTILFIIPAVTLTARGPIDRHEVRSGMRKMKKDNLKEAEIDFRKALVKDSTSFTANYDLAGTLYKMNKGNAQGMAEAAKYLQTVMEEAAVHPEYGDEYFFNLGDIALQMKDYKNAVEAFKQSLLRNPGDLQAKENYIYARKMLENQQNQQDQNQDQQNQDQNKDQQDQDQNQDQQNQDQNKDQNNQDQNQDQQNQNQNQDKDQQNQDRNQQNPQGGEAQITPQAAQQMLQAIQDKEKETQEKVKAEKAAAMKSRQREKNW